MNNTVGIIACAVVGIACAIYQFVYRQHGPHSPFGTPGTDDGRNAQNPQPCIHCPNPMQPNEIVVLNCNHNLHVNCFLQLHTSGIDRCPVCRTPFE